MEEVEKPKYSAKPSAEIQPQAASAEDIAYTINHALACTATDFIDPWVGNWTQKILGKRVKVGCNHDHGHGHGHHHHHHSHLRHWVVGEVVGDFGAVPVTVGMQYLFPNAMSDIKGLLEPVLGGFFRSGAERSAKRWAKEQGIEADSPACRTRAEHIYQHEVNHLPQALLWTVSSVALNLTTQRLMGNHAPLWQLAAGKATGASISAGLVVGGRGLFPQAAREWDQLTSRHLFIPATKAVGQLIGIDEKTIDKLER